jgi:hypothetical protein
MRPHWEGLPISLCWAKSIQFLLLTPISLRSILILFFHLCLGLLRSIFPIGLPVNHIDVIILTILGEWQKLQSSSLWHLLHSPFSSLLDPDIHLRIWFSNTHGLYSSLELYWFNLQLMNIKLSLWLTAPKGATPVN